jgi:hypothetical protein
MRTSNRIAAALAAAALGIQGDIAHAGNPCAATAKAANEACRNEKTDEYFIAVGNCLNLSTLDATKACKKAAKHDLADAKSGDCADQRDARLALCDQLGKAPYDPAISQADFLSPAATAANPNQYFPLVPGTIWVYQGGGEIDTVTVTDKTKVVDGVTTIVVHDVVTDTNHVPTEDTNDFFAQKTDGSVWYFGEESQQLEDGVVVGVEGSFKAGIDGAKPGIIMEAAPKVGDVYRQEFALGDAEDAAEVISTTGTESVPAASCTGTCVVTHEFSPLEPEANEQKFYASGIGVILEVDVAEGGTRLELVSFTPGSP